MLRRSIAVSFALGACCILPASALAAAPLTPAGWRVDPAGTEIAVSQAAVGFQGPIGAALSPDGNWLLGASSGAARFESADLFDLAARQRTSSVGYDATKGEAAFYGAAWARDGQTAYVSGGGQNVIHVLRREGRDLSETASIAAPAFPAGLAYGRMPGGDRLYVANNLSAIGAGNPGHQVTVIDRATNTVERTIASGPRCSRSASRWTHHVSGRARRSSSPRMTPRTVPTTSTRIARSRSSSALTRRRAGSTPRTTTRRR
jgi:hypothetical protein